MHIGLVGLGRMGGNMRDRLRAAGVAVTGYDQNPDLSDVASIAQLVDAIGDGGPRVVWVMVPAGEITESVVADVASRPGAGDVIIAGGNSNYTDDLRPAAAPAQRETHYGHAGGSGAAR